ncbi:UNKNOWN [Stylonychia lemnae]|uniref:Uncharacterized protein n=1 Tax=Stylonychia lemnae TaxID=5949 RepID=A0A078B6P2_STYLE|nr:UNKNOWN [Stylonychia lemnae]|eukprot:CDW89233.1 UNKNOWN [Stylonychia lemnae]
MEEPRTENNEQSDRLQAVDNLQLNDLKQQLLVMQDQKNELDKQLSLQDQEYQKIVQDMKFKLKDYKLQVQEFQIKIKHVENRLSQKDEYIKRLIEDNNSKNDLELETIKRMNNLEMERLCEKNEANLQQIKEIHEIEARQLNQKITEMKSQVRMQEFKITELQSDAKDSVHSSVEMLENIHLRYLDEIRSLNGNLSSFRVEKENEIKNLMSKLRLAEDKLQKVTIENDLAQKKLVTQKNQYESKILGNRKRIDEMYRQITEHEKYELSLHASKQKINELKAKIQQLEYKDKWNWKSLVKKRSEIENEKVELKRKINSQYKQNQEKLTTQRSMNEDLEKKLNVMQVELQSARFQKQILKEKCTELAQEVSCLRKDNSVSLYSSRGALSSQRLFLTRSVSPGTAADAQNMLRGGANCRSRQNINQSQQNGKFLSKQLASARYNNQDTPLEQCTDTSKYISPRDYPVPKSNIAQKVKPIFKKNSMQEHLDHQLARKNLRSKERIFNNEMTSMPSPIGTSQKHNYLKDSTQELPPPMKLATQQNKKVSLKLNPNDFNEDDANSFLASPKQDIISFFNGSTQIHDSKVGNICDSSIITKGARPKAMSQYDVRCRVCSYVFESLDSFLRHQTRCKGLLDMNYDDGDITNLSDKDLITGCNNVIDSLAGSPDMRKPSLNNPPNKMLEFRESDINSQQIQLNYSALQALTKNASMNNLNTPQRSRISSNTIPLNQITQSSMQSNNFNNLILGESDLQQAITGNFPNQSSRLQADNQLHLNIKDINEAQIAINNTRISADQCNLASIRITHEEEQSDIPLTVKHIRENGENQNFLMNDITQQTFVINPNITQTFNRTLSTRTQVDLETENDRLVNDLKNAKMELALVQEKQESNELMLKKEIINLQLRLSQFSQAEKSGSPTPNCKYGQYEQIIHNNFSSTASLNHMQSNQSFTQNSQPTMAQSNANYQQTTNGTCYTIGCNSAPGKNEFGFNRARMQQLQQNNQMTQSLTLKNNMNTSQFLQPKSMLIKDGDYSSPQKYTNDDPFSDGMNSELKVVVMNSPSENIESPEPNSLRLQKPFQIQAFEEESNQDRSSQSSNNIRINRSPNLLLRKLN